MSSSKIADPASYAADSSLGKAAGTERGEGAAILHPISRAAYRATIEGYSASQPMYGYDGWQCFEVSWLNARGKPQIAAGYFVVPLDASVIVESKSLKLYLNSLNQQSFSSPQVFAAQVSADLSSLLGVTVTLQLYAVDAGKVGTGGWPHSVSSASGIANNITNDIANHIVLDDLDVACSTYQRDPGLLSFTARQVDSESLVSHCLRSNCPVTNQPDWATLSLCYSGRQLEHGSLLQYIASYREHSGFHEQTVEQIFCDLANQPEIQQLCVQARYTRRGGIAINPTRSTSPLE